LHYGTALAKQFGASLVALHVVEPLSVETDFGYGTFIRHLPNLAELNVSKMRLTGLGRKLERPGSALSAITRSGCVHEEIIRAAEEIDADLILLGGEGIPVGGGQDLCGTVQKVLSHAPCPVLVLGQNFKACGGAPLAV
jgi:nucleotide-binding universal stress UspA family protein